MSVRMLVTVDDHGNVRASCSCGDFNLSVGPVQSLGFVQGPVGSHVTLHATAEATDTPWESIRGSMNSLQAWIEQQDDRS